VLADSGLELVIAMSVPLTHPAHEGTAERLAGIGTVTGVGVPAKEQNHSE